VSDTRVVATAGHIDHGKSSLVLALTGTDPDRLAEEKQRGLTIDLGFAFCTLPSGVELAFVDVPGHVRFLKNMLAGVGGVDAALLVVAATEGWMPQSEEHLRILDLLDVEHGVVAVTKADLVDDETVEIAELDVLEHLEGSTLEGARIVVCDAKSGRGLEEVRTALDEMLAGAPPPADGGRPRLWIDRVFASRGAGTVVTGTLTGGSLALEDEVLIAPGRRRARVRGLESHHRKVAVAAPGTRVAVNLAGVDHDELHRGDAVVRADQWIEPRVVDVSLSLLAGVELPARSRMKVYAGSGEHDAAVRRLDDDHRFARLFLGARLPLQPGDRLVLRDPGRQETVGGAVVLDVAPTARARLAPERLDRPLGERLLRSHPWLAVADLPALAGRDAAGARALAGELVAGGQAVRIGGHLVATETLESLRTQVRPLVAAHHREQPLEAGPELSSLASRLRVPPEQLEAALHDVADLVVERGRVRAATHVVAAADDPEAVRYLEALAAQPFSPASAAELGVRPEIVRALVRSGHVVDLEGVVLSTAAVDDARRLVVEAIRRDGSITVAGARDVLGSSRKYVLAILGHFDKTGVTRRSGDDRTAGPRADG
jgi:selenocysteine-specific elongation factor